MADEELDKGTAAASNETESPKTPKATEAKDEKAGATKEAAKSKVKGASKTKGTKADETDEAKKAEKSSKKAKKSEKSEKLGKAGKDVDDDVEDVDDSDDDDLDLPMDKIEALLDVANVDKKNLTPQMRRVAQRQAETTKRVEETIKKTKANPRWFVPLFCFFMILGLAWAVVYYLTSKYPIPGIGAWNLLIAFVVVMVGFFMTMWWR